MNINYCGQSGGKDSQALALWMIHESGYDPKSLRFSFCDTHWESPLTYDHIRYLSDYYQSQGCAPIVWLEPELGFFELAKRKKRFPSAKARFCTQYLKVIPTRNDVMSLLRAGNEVLLHSGVRREEANGNKSHPRYSLPGRSFDDAFGCEVYRPLISWSLTQVLDYSKKFGVRLNPLYGLGASRCGCFPCIMSRKKEIESSAKKFPSRIDEIASMEREIDSTFFACDKVPVRFRSKRCHTKDGRTVFAPTIRDVVEWSNTSKGGFRKSGELFSISLDDQSLVCASGMGMCE